MKMSRLFNNKYSIAVLVAISIVFCVSKIVSSATSDEEVLSEIPEMLDMEMTDADKNQARSLKSVVVSDLFWKDINKRDPFSNKKRLRTNKASIANKEVSSKYPPRLTGFIAGATSRLAVLDGQIVGEGSAINNYRVVNIDAQGVHLTRGNKHVVLTLSVE
ncbi:MAG: hypothetical protein JKX75_08140 [Gammaproteobacteria bacterium]|nr:hypothetical protein [Gammaproteobacteria bacterium]